MVNWPWVASSSFKGPNQPGRCFKIAELRSATDNFDKKWCIGHGGCGDVYRSKTSNGPNNNYAIKLLHFKSGQGEPELWNEVNLLSKLRHCNLVSLIGYCKERKNMALVYEYMHNGSLYDHLHKRGTVFTWSKLLEICIGAGRGLDYLHTGTGTKDGVVHRDVKTANILLDEDFAAKIGDFGLARRGPINQTRTDVSTQVKGSTGYLDLSYFYTGRVSRKSDVYSFGVVLLEVLSGRTVLDNGRDEMGLVYWAKDLISRGESTEIINPKLRDLISKDSFEEYLGIANQCLLDRPDERPTMADVVSSLVWASLLQKGQSPSLEGEVVNRASSSLLHEDDFAPRMSEVISSLARASLLQEGQAPSLDGEVALSSPSHEDDFAARVSEASESNGPVIRATRAFKRCKNIDVHQADIWWSENRDKIYMQENHHDCR